MDRQDLKTDMGAASLVDDDILAEFLSRQGDLLDEMEQMVLALEDGAGAPDELLRYFHTLKGEAGLLGYPVLAEVCHTVESLLQKGASGCVDLLLEVRDWLGGSFAAIADGAGASPAEDLLASLRAAGEEPAPGPAPETAAAAAAEIDEQTLRDFLDESGEHLEAAEASLLLLEDDPRAADPVNRAFRAFHTIKGVAGFLGLDVVEAIAHGAEGLLDASRTGGEGIGAAGVDAALSAVDMLQRLLDDLKRRTDGAGELPDRPEATELVAKLRELGGRREPRPESDRTSGLILLNPVAGGDADAGSDGAGAGSAAGKVPVREAVRVDAARLDKLVEALGEMVIAEAMVSHSAELRGKISGSLRGHLDNLDKISRELQEIGLSLRMMPVRPVFQKMNRLARDLSRKTGRPVELHISGEDTELDRAVVDKISDPLVHMIRNAVDHGIEADVAGRRAAGKPDTGRIDLRAFHRGGNICIEIQDDGRGLDRGAILAKAEARGLVEPDAELDDRQVYDLIFEPGFSTAAKVTDVSGRGVGMDVVRRNIESLRGSVEIDSRPGEGSVFSILLPLTLAIIDGMVVRVGGEQFIVPTLAMIRLVRPEPGQITRLTGRGEMLDFEGTMVPLLRTAELFGVDGAVGDPAAGVVVVVEDGLRRAGLLVDSPVGQQQIVIKSLGDTIQGTEGLAGGAILSDGRVAPILDVGSLIRDAAAAPAGKA